MAELNGPDDLDRRIAAAKAGRARPVSPAERMAESRGWAIGIEFVGAVLVSGFLGYAIDRWAGLGTAPFAMIGMLVLGFAAGTYRAMQTTARLDGPADSPSSSGK